MVTEDKPAAPSTEVSLLKSEVDPDVSHTGDATSRHDTSREATPAGGSRHPDRSANVGRLAIGERLSGRYRIKRVLGEGGMGVVYLARDMQVAGETFAIKVLKESLRPEALELLREEVRKARKLSHPNIVDVHSVNVDGQRLYVLMEYLEGMALDALLSEEFGRGMPFSHAWPIIEDVGAALGYAHDHNVIHSDLKPANIFLTTSGKTKLLDFGIARLSRRPLMDARTGPLALTPAYASCEMLRGKEADRRDDIYSFACLIYEMLSGEHPFGDLNALEAREADARVPPLGVLTQGQNAALAQALAFDRTARTASVEKLVAGLRADTRARTGPISLVAAVAIVGVAAGGVTYVALDRLWVSRHSVVVQGMSSGQQATATAAALKPPPQSIAVLPLANESGDAGQQYFSDGLSEDLITALSQFPELKVIGRTSSFQFRNPKEDSHSIGAKLGVAHLLEGTVRRSGGVVRVRAELIDTADGSTQWSESYDRPYQQIFAVQDDITRTVAVALRARLLPSERGASQSDRPPGGSLEAYNALLQGQFYFSRDTETDFRKAIEYYAHATQLDPRYALAWSGLARAWARLGAEFLDSAPMQEAYSKAREAADRALAVSPELAAAHLARGAVLGDNFEWGMAEQEFLRALELSPNNAEAKFSVGRMLATVGKLQPAIELTRQALATEPLQAGWYNWLAAYLSALGRLDDAERAVGRSLELQPGSVNYHQTLAIIQIQRGNEQAALAVADQQTPGRFQDTTRALARQLGGDRSAADAALKTLNDRYDGSAAYQVAEIYALRNDAKETFEWLDRAWSSRDPGITSLLFDPFILRYKDDPRFAAFCRKVGLPVPAAQTRKS